ncbi:MAG: hypothetical protein HQ468_07585 [Actinomycetales bacterium]|jgi:hypothetical protein|nr:hypothetical protein [Actinomycetales bacterium]|tara:strand:+ start:5669 stop:6019 length:351 start_codon:yes stop_codon:yes gene_type:complete
MEFIYDLVVILHFIGLASVVGGFIVQISSSEKGVNAAMFHGALTQLVTGLILVGMVEGGAVDEEINMTKISVKLAIVLVVTVLAFMGRKKTPPQVALWGAIGALSISNIFIAVLWS